MPDEKMIDYERAIAIECPSEMVRPALREACEPHVVIGEDGVARIEGDTFRRLFDDVLDQLPGSRAVLESRRGDMRYWAESQRRIDAERARLRAALARKPK